MKQSQGLEVYPIGVTQLSKLVYRQGDIHFRYDRSTSAEEGLKTQHRLQRNKFAGYQSEVAVAVEIEIADLLFRVQGRIDGMDLGLDETGVEQPLTKRIAVLEEYKTSRTDLLALHRHSGHLHWAQLKLYGAIQAHLHAEIDTWHLKLIYAHPDNLERQEWEQCVESATLKAFLLDTCSIFAGMLHSHRRYLAERDSQLKQLRFPFPAFRRQQRSLSKVCYRAFASAEHILLEAPTGCGKTLGTLFPALKALAHDRPDRIVYLSSRSTGQLAAQEACSRLMSGGEGSHRTSFRYITIRARDSVCPIPGTPCDPAVCNYARGYYDRLPAAIDEALALQGLLPEVLAEVAEKHRVCPFELSLDSAVYCDLIIADCNYVFDPLVRLKRISGLFSERVLLLVDEAHQLVPRVRGMLSAEFDRGLLLRVLKEQQPLELIRAVKALDRQLLKIRCSARKGSFKEPNTELQCRIEFPQVLIKILERFIKILSQMELAQPDSALKKLSMAAFRFLKAAEWFDDEHFQVLLKSQGHAIQIKLFCLDPSQHIANTLRGFQGSVRFSATLSPPQLFKRAQGSLHDSAWQMASPFTAEQLGVTLVTDINTRYRHRSGSLHRLVDLIHQFQQSKLGHYMVALPSFAYLDMVAEAYQQKYPDDRLRCQRRSMDQASQDRFLQRFMLDQGTSLLGLVVLGGRFTESVDYPGNSLIGMLIVSVSLPPPDYESLSIERHFSGSLGFQLAYQQPAMTRIVQAAGRIVRRASDRGIVCLVDDRFRQHSYQAFFPPNWQVSCCRASDVLKVNGSFWSKAGNPEFCHNSQPNGPEPVA